MTSTDEAQIVAEIVRGLDDDDIVAIPGVAEFICQHYSDEIGERYASRLLIAQEQAAEFQREIA
jgi:hypothetical protein